MIRKFLNDVEPGVCRLDRSWAAIGAPPSVSFNGVVSSKPRVPKPYIVLTGKIDINHEIFA